MKKVTLPDVYSTQAPTAIVIYTSACLPEDWLFSYFDGQYLSGKIQKQEGYMDRGVVMSSLNNDSSTLPNGNVIGEEIKLGILKNGKTYELNPATILLNGETVTQIIAGNFSIYYAHDCEIGDEITTEIKETPYVTWYYSQCPILETLEFDAGTKAVGEEFYIHMFQPKFCKSFTYKVLKGKGVVKFGHSRTPIYKVGQGDLEAGEVLIQINTVAYENCSEGDVSFTAKILFDKPEVDPNDGIYFSSDYFNIVKSAGKIYLEVTSTHGTRINYSVDGVQTYKELYKAAMKSGDRLLITNKGVGDFYLFSAEFRGFEPKPTYLSNKVLINQNLNLTLPPPEDPGFVPVIPEPGVLYTGDGFQIISTPRIYQNKWENRLTVSTSTYNLVTIQMTMTYNTGKTVIGRASNNPNSTGASAEGLVKFVLFKGTFDGVTRYLPRDVVEL
jgi:hypothetical protein